MLNIEVNYQNGDSTITQFNGTFQEAKAYYVGRTFNIGSDKDDLQVCTSIRLLDSEEKKFKKTGKGTVSVGTLCSLINGRVRLIDNGNGELLETGDAANFVKGEYSAYAVGTVTASFGEILIWIPRK